ncbi:F0F1 ATP synthase subunit B [Candidatus Uhrbacteria bacterium]|nr:F0F1 ATP synthase subunit B [Candidatus Uhrbacteria bacterium]
MEILEKLGIDWRILIAQIVNFGVLLFVLHRFLYKPVLAILQKRADTIEKSLGDARALEERLKASELAGKELIKNAKREAAGLLEDAHKLAEQKRASALKKAKEEVERFVVDAREKIAIEKEQSLREAREYFADLVLQASKAVLEESVQEPSPATVKKVIGKFTQV